MVGTTNIQGKINIIKVHDTSGIFRFSKLFIEIDTDYEYKRLKTDPGYTNSTIKEISTFVLKIVNRIIDSYRHITKEAHFERLSELDVNIRDIYFVEPNLGFNGILPKNGFQSATMNRSITEIDKFKDDLYNGTEYPVYEFLFLSAESSYDKNMFTLALVQSFQAFEIFLESFLRLKFTERCIDDKEATEKLKKPGERKNA